MKGIERFLLPALSRVATTAGVRNRSSTLGPVESTTFWALIDDTRRVSDGCPETHASVLARRLSRLEPSEIVEFERIWRELDVAAYRWELWAAAYLLNGGCDDVCFEHFRSYVIALGEQVYAAAIEEADSLVFLANGPGHQFAHDAEALGYAATDAYELATGGGELPDTGPELPDAPSGVEWDAETPQVAAPRIATAVGWLEA